MNDFEDYMPQAWQVDGLTVRPAVRKVDAKRTARRDQTWKAHFTACAFSVGIALLSYAVPSGSSGSVSSTNSLPKLASYQVNPVYADVPIGYWPKLVNTLRQAPALPDDVSEHDPEPLI